MTPTKETYFPEPLDERALTIYVDGSMRSSPRRGGIGIRFVWVNDDGEEEVWDHSLPATMGATNNEMELEAPSQALKLATSRYTPFDLVSFDKIVIRTDSLYVHDNLPIAVSVWSKNRWTKRQGGAVLNVRDWKNLLTLMRRMRTEHRLSVSFEWKKGKKGKHAKAVDVLAKQSSDSPSFGRARPSVVRQKKSPQQVEPGSVRMEGQIMSVRIIQAQYLPPPHRRSRYKYEVVDKESPYFENVDWAESNHELKRGHTYMVRVNADMRNPRIEEVLEEVEEDLTPYLDALKEIGRPATLVEVAEEVTRAQQLSVSPVAARYRLDRLVNEHHTVKKSRMSTAGRPNLYEVIE
jgi:ribonuclease HI